MKDNNNQLKSEITIKEEVVESVVLPVQPAEPPNRKEKHLKKTKNNNDSEELTLVLEPQERSSYFDNNDNNDTSVQSHTEKKTETNKIAKSIEIFCKLCQTLFTGRSVFECHYRNNHQENPIFSCNSCNYNVGKYQLYRAHFNRHSTKEQYSRKICKKCNEQFDTAETFREHAKSHGMSGTGGGSVCNQCGKILMTIGGLYTHRKMHEEKPRFKCDICEREFFQKVNLINHTKTHEGHRPFQCSQCDKAFFEKSHLQRHLNFHTLVRSYKCDVCEKSYKTERCLKVHSAVHSTYRPFVCCVCSKGFLSSSKLKQHFNIHTGERPFKCKSCDRDFTNYPNLLKHTIRRHKVDHRTGEKLESIPDYVTNKKKAKGTSTKVKKEIKIEENSNRESTEEEMISHIPPPPAIIESSNVNVNVVENVVIPSATENQNEEILVKLEPQSNSRKNSMSLITADDNNLKEFHINDNSNDFDMYAAEIDQLFAENEDVGKINCAVDFSDILTETNNDLIIPSHDISTTVTSLTFPFYSFPENSNQFQLINPNLIHMVNCRQMENSIDT